MRIERSVISNDGAWDESARERDESVARRRMGRACMVLVGQ